MARASSPKLLSGERRVVVVRRHWWFAVRTICWLVPLLSLPPLYALADYCLPGVGLAMYANAVDVAILVVSGLVLLKWLASDVLGWLAATWVLTNQRLIEQRGLMGVRRREASLRLARTREAVQHGLAARLLDYGDLVVEVEGRGSVFVLSRVPRPRELAATVQWLGIEAKEEHRRVSGGGGERIQAALTRVFRGGRGDHDMPTVELERITPLSIAAQRRLRGGAVLYATRQHPVTLARGLALPLAAAFAAWLAMCVWSPIALAPAAIAGSATVALLLCWIVQGWRGRLYVVTPDSLVQLHNPLALGRRDATVDLRSVRDVVACTAPISGRLMNIGSILLERRDAPPVVLRAVPDPDRLKHLILRVLDDAEEEARLAEQEQSAVELSDWFEQYRRMQLPP